jgi:hypothetical protein
MSSSKDPLLGNGHAIRYDITDAAKQQISNTATIMYEYIGTQELYGATEVVYYAVRAEAAVALIQSLGMTLPMCVTVVCEV